MHIAGLVGRNAYIVQDHVSRIAKQNRKAYNRSESKIRSQSQSAKEFA